ncbi:unnamed protein product [Heligmosomoides polygyrus]|uniref:Lipocalin n=1 Tax=Heligmosomoides polygyrus TaxID=6339 RepID=A0A183GDY6_HELPZ|nr:unnamed protein product [Heligmosomoides polygyrus]
MTSSPHRDAGLTNCALKRARLEVLSITAAMFFRIAVLLCFSATIYAKDSDEQCHDITRITMDTVTDYIGKTVPKLKWSTELKDRAVKYAEDESEDDGNYIYLKKEMSMLSTFTST